MRIAASSDESVHLTDHVVSWLRNHGHDVIVYGALKSSKPEMWARAAEELAQARDRVQILPLMETARE